jgi:hypothetical protein
MKTANAVKKLTGLGFVNKGTERRFSFAHPATNYRIEFIDQAGSAICLGIRRQDDHSDSMSDYCATCLVVLLELCILGAKTKRKPCLTACRCQISSVCMTS